MVKLNDDEWNSQMGKALAAIICKADNNGNPYIRLEVDNTKVCRCAQNPMQCPINLADQCDCEEKCTS